MSSSSSKSGLAKRGNGKKKSTLRIGVFNYKGGVGKTTFTANLGAAFSLASNQSTATSLDGTYPSSGPGLRVLMVDADPQCNLTSFYLPVANAVCLDRMQIFGSDALPVKIEQSSFIYDHLHPIVRCSKMSAFIGESTNKPLWQMLRRFKIKRAESLERLCFAEPPFTVCDQGRPDLYGDRLCILEGCQNLYDYETMFSEAFRALNTSKDDVDMNTLAFSLIFDILESKYGFDVILVDMNPSHSQLNKAIAIACDFILPVVQASLYSCASLHGLFSNVLRPREATNSNQVSGWLDTRDLIVERQEEMQTKGEKDDFMLRASLFYRDPTRMLPLLVNNYAVNTVKTYKGVTTITMQIQPSQFIYTMIDYINTTLNKDAAMEISPSDITEDDLVAVDGHYVVPFLPSLPLGVAAAEEMGRPFVEATSYGFAEYWNAEKAAAVDDDMSGEIDDHVDGDDIIFSLDHPFESSGSKRHRSSQAVSSSSQQPKKLRRTGNATKVIQAVEKTKDTEKMDKYYKKMDSEFMTADKRFVSLAMWLTSFLGKENATMIEGAVESTHLPVAAPPSAAAAAAADSSSSSSTIPRLSNALVAASSSSSSSSSSSAPRRQLQSSQESSSSSIVFLDEKIGGK